MVIYDNKIKFITDGINVDLFRAFYIFEFEIKPLCLYMFLQLVNSWRLTVEKRFIIVKPKYLIFEIHFNILIVTAKPF